MSYELAETYCAFRRDAGDSRISHESTVGYRLKLQLNRDGYNFVRLNPSKHGLTSCKVGLIDHKKGIILWHERYQIENAATEYNHGEVTFMRTPVDDDEESAS